jgi:hypothetical protein
MMELTNKEKKKFLLARGWSMGKGFAVPTPPADESDWTFVSSDDIWKAIRKGEKEYFNLESYNWVMYDLEDAFDYEFENLGVEDENFEMNDDDLIVKVKCIIAEYDKQSDVNLREGEE